jgi:hypothetical protein
LEIFGYSFEGHHGRAVITKEIVNIGLLGYE